MVQERAQQRFGSHSARPFDDTVLAQQPAGYHGTQTGRRCEQQSTDGGSVSLAG
jgi:hypothetical protein